jgi:hypothetical protein
MTPQNTHPTITTLAGTRDPLTGDTFYPARHFSVDGRLRHLEPVDIPAVGVLAEVIAMGERWFGYIDLDAGPRLLTRLGPGPHAVGARYQRPLGGDGSFERA